MRFFAQLRKIDVERREVVGVATAEVADRAKEILDYATSKPYIESWSKSFEDATGGKSLGNVRAMHKTIAAGKLTAINFDDANMTVEVVAKIVDDAEWKKVEEGVYTGFSFGGEYAKRWRDPSNTTLTRYTAAPSELSLADIPCVPSATFEILKTGGAVEQKPFQRLALLKAVLADDSMLKAAQVVELMDTYLPVDAVERFTADENTTIGDLRAALKKFAAAAPAEEAPPLAKTEPRADADPKAGTKKYGKVKFADEANKKYPIDTEAHVKAALSYWGKSAKYSNDDQKAIGTKIRAAAKSFGVDVADDDQGLEKFVRRGALAKSIYSLVSFANLMQSIAWLCQDAQSEMLLEADASGVPNKLREWLASGVEIYLEMSQEETEEMLASLGYEGDDAAAEKVATFFGLAKAGARHSKADKEMVQAIHDHAANLGADCDGMGGDSAKVATVTMRKRALGAEVERDELRKTVEQLGEEKTAHLAKIAQLEKMPLPPKGGTRAIAKAADGTITEGPAGSPAAGSMVSAGIPAEALGAMKELHKSGGTVVDR